MYKEKF